MRGGLLAVTVVLALGCQRGAPSIRAEEPTAADAELHDTNVGDVSDSYAEADVAETAPIPTRTATRMRFATHVLTMASHGIDGTFELWRDSRIDDEWVEGNWFGAPFDRGEVVAGFEKSPPVSAQVVLRDARRAIVESLDLVRPVAKMTPVQLGEEGAPYLEVAIDTFAGAGRWGGTTHRFVRVEGGHSRWLDCAEAYRCLLGCNFHFDPRPGGGVDILAWRHEYVETLLINPITYLTRVEVDGGTCKPRAKTVKGWLGEAGSGTAIHVPGDFPGRR